jgi:hypothetical protein
VVLVKSLVPGELNPGATVGPGIYDFLVRVDSPRGDVIVSGGKSSADASLTWEADGTVGGIGVSATRGEGTR